MSAITLEAAHDIRVEDLAANAGTGTLALSNDIRFDANANGGNQGSFVMAIVANTISDPGHNVTIYAGNAPTSATGTLNFNATDSAYAIRVGNITTASTTVTGGAGGNVALHVLSQPGQGGSNAVFTGAITTSGLASATQLGGAAGSITIDAPTTFTNVSTATGGPFTFSTYGLAPECDHHG